MHFMMAVSPFVFLNLFLSLAETKSYRPIQFNPYKAGPSPHYYPGKPTSRHMNHCAYVVEKTVSFTVPDGAAPYVKAEYNKCSWANKCPTLLYRLLYKPIYKVAHKTVTELEWRCCPGFSGYSCMEGSPAYQYPAKSMQPFKGPPFNDPQYKGPMFNGPVFKGPPFSTGVKANPWNQHKGPPTGTINSYSTYHFGPPRTSSYPDTNFDPDPSEPEPMPDSLEPHHTEDDQEPEQEQEFRQGPEEHIKEETPPPSSSENLEGRTLDSGTEERLYQIEEDVRRLNQGLEMLRGTVNGLENSLRASLREDANRMLSALLSAAPGPLPAPMVASTIGFVEIPGGDPETEGLDGRDVPPGITDVNGRMEAFSQQLQAKTRELQVLKVTVMGHDRALRKLSNRPGIGLDSNHSLAGDTQRAMEKFLDDKLSAARTEILGRIEKGMDSAALRYNETAGEVHSQCQNEQDERQVQLAGALDEQVTELRTELRTLQAQIHGQNDTDSCCMGVFGLGERVKLLEVSVAGLNQSHGQLRVQFGGHKDHIDGMLEGRLAYVETKLNLTGLIQGRQSIRTSRVSNRAETGQGLEARVESKLRTLEGRLLTALESFGNTTTPNLLEDQAVPALETELQSLRSRLDTDVDRVQKQLSALEILCSSPCPSLKTPTAIQGDSAVPSPSLKEKNVKEILDMQTEHLKSLNITLENLLNRLRDQQDQSEAEPPIQGELTILKFNVRSVNHTLRGLQDTLMTMSHQVGQSNSTWHEREARLAQQMRGVVQLVGHQASMLGAGERRLTRLKSELQEVKRRLAEEIKGCRSTALGVKKEVTEVGGRVASVEDQCKGLNNLVQDLEKIREELEKQPNGIFLHVNGTLSSHAQQLSELRDELRNCNSKVEPAKQSVDSEPEPRRGDIFTPI